RLRPVVAPDRKRLAGLLADLDSDDFDTRHKAYQELEKLGPTAEPTLRAALAGRPSLEVWRRIQSLLRRLEGDQLRAARAVEGLEWVNTPEARRLLGTLARGAAGARLTAEATAALRRLEGRTARP